MRRSAVLTPQGVATINEVFRARGISLPLPEQGTVTDTERYRQRLAVQAPLYGNEIKDNLADLPEPFNTALSRFLTEFCFGDFYTRGGLTLAQRELLVLCALATIGDTAAQPCPVRHRVRLADIFTGAQARATPVNAVAA